MSLTDIMEISGSSHYPAKVVWGMHAGQVDRLKYAPGLVGASLRLLSGWHAASVSTMAGLGTGSL